MISPSLSELTGKSSSAHLRRQSLITTKCAAFIIAARVHESSGDDPRNHPPRVAASASFMARHLYRLLSDPVSRCRRPKFGKKPFKIDYLFVVFFFSNEMTVAAKVAVTRVFLPLLFGTESFRRKLKSALQCQFAVRFHRQKCLFFFFVQQGKNASYRGVPIGKKNSKRKRSVINRDSSDLAAVGVYW